MSLSNILTPDNALECPFTFFGSKTYKIYNDGENYVATLCWRKLKARKPAPVDCNLHSKPLTDKQKDVIFDRVMRNCQKTINSKSQKKLSLGLGLSAGFSSRGDKDILFDSLYLQTVKKGWTYRKNKAEMTDYIRAGVIKIFGDSEDLDGWIDEKIKRSLNNLQHRKKRFRRKAYLNKWNYFVTFTYDDKKQTEETFRKRLRKCLSNLHTRRGWRYMGVFEHAPETGRLHFHGLLYIPDGELVGNIVEKQDYSTAQHKMQTYYENDFFMNTFGRNDFEELSETEMKDGRAVDYIVKYIGKTGERICYSRGIPTEFYKQLDDSDIITEFTDFVTKYVIFNRVVDYERDIMRRTDYKQLKFLISQSGKSWLIA